MVPTAANFRDRRPRVAIVGGGISGLAAAHRLTELLPGAALTLFEASGRLGGVLETTVRDGYLIERSADNFLTSRPAAVALCQRLGIADQLLPTNESGRRAAVVRDGQLMPIPSGFYLMSPRKLGPVLRSPVLSLRGKLRLLAEPLIPPRSRAEAVGHDSDIDAPWDESVASFARRRLGNEVFERLVQPLVGGIYTADANQLSMAATMPEFLAYEREHGSLLRATLCPRRSAPREPGLIAPSLDGGGRSVSRPNISGARYNLFVAPRDGMGSLVSVLAGRLTAAQLRVNTPVTSAHLQSDGTWELRLGEGGATELFDALICALPAHAAAGLLEPYDSRLADELRLISYSSCAVVSCAFRREQIANRLDGFGFVVPQSEGRRIVAASFASNKFPGRAPSEHVLIRTFVGGTLQPELFAATDDELRRLVVDELGDLLSIKGLPQRIDIARWPRSMPQYQVGHLTRIARIERLTARSTSLALAGNAYHGVGIPQCIASGESAAERIVAQIKPGWSH